MAHAYRESGSGFCGICDDMPGEGNHAPEAEGVGTPTPQEPEFLQVYMAHDIQIAAFQRWVISQGWELKLMPRFNEDDDTYVPTHMIVPANLDKLMAERAAQYRKDHPDGC